MPADFAAMLWVKHGQLELYVTVINNNISCGHFLYNIVLSSTLVDKKLRQLTHNKMIKSTLK